MTKGDGGGKVGPRGEPKPIAGRGSPKAEGSRQDAAARNWRQRVFVGRHERQLDPKGRLALPASYRPRFEPSCFLSFGNDGCVEVWTRELFEETTREATDKMKRGEISREAWRG